MNINLIPFAVVWAVLAAALIVLIVYRKMVARTEDDTLHVLEDANVVPQQAAFARKLDRIDKWGKTLTIVTIVYGLIVGAGFVYQNFVDASMNPLR